MPAGERYPLSSRTEACQRRLLSAEFDAEQWRLPGDWRVVRRRHPINVLPSRDRREFHDLAAVLSKVGIDYADGITGLRAGTDPTAAAGGSACASRGTGLRTWLFPFRLDLPARAWRNDRPDRRAGFGPGRNECRHVLRRPCPHLARLRPAVDYNTGHHQSRLNTGQIGRAKRTADRLQVSLQKRIEHQHEVQCAAEAEKIEQHEVQSAAEARTAAAYAGGFNAAQVERCRRQKRLWRLRRWRRLWPL